MKDLLTQWAKLEPERCQRWENGSYWLMFGDWNYSPDSPGALQEAVQQAIEARGWKWGIQKGLSLCEVNVRGFGYVSNKPPAHTLLSAYLQALKAAKAHGVTG